MGRALPLSDREWALQSVDAFPRSWQARILARWRRDHNRDRTAGNLGLLRRVRTLADSAKGGIRPDASDSEICTQADVTARDFARRLALVKSAIERGPKMAAVRERYGLRPLTMMLAHYAQALMARRGLLDLWPAIKGATANASRTSALKRLQCARWWRRTYRKLHARTVEVYS